jgi:signal transduction histidine kinase
MEQPAHILVVGEPAIRERCQRVLSAEGYTVDSADDDPGKLKGLSRGAFDLVILDLVKDGAKTFDPEEVKAIDPLAVVVAVTGPEEMELTFQKRRDFVYEAIPRSFTPTQLLSAVRRGTEVRRLRGRIEELTSEKEELRRSVFHFLSIAAHELRAPLAAVESYLSAYLTGAGGPDPELNRQMLQRAKARSHALIDLVGDLLQYVRLESGGAPRKRVVFDPSEIIVNTVELFRRQAEERTVRIVADVPGRLPLIEGHPSEIEQVFTNLISNAIKYNKEGGQVLVRTEEERGTLRIIVADEGIGIGEEDLPHIFDEFYRVSRPETRYTMGTGMGLTIVKKIVESHSGRIRVESAVDAGTTFIVELPVHKDNEIAHTLSQG